MIPEAVVENLLEIRPTWKCAEKHQGLLRRGPEGSQTTGHVNAYTDLDWSVFSALDEVHKSLFILGKRAVTASNSGLPSSSINL